jgi:hypothetical protein
MGTYFRSRSVCFASRPAPPAPGCSAEATAAGARLLMWSPLCFLLVQALLAARRDTAEERSFLYLIRLLAFALILAAVWFKNREARR